MVTSRRRIHPSSTQSWSSLILLAALASSSAARSTHRDPFVQRASGQDLNFAQQQQHQHLLNPLRRPSSQPVAALPSRPITQDSDECLQSTTAREINRILSTGGPETQVLLCQNGHVSIDPHSEPIRFTAPRQMIYTQHLPHGHARATIAIETGSTSSRYNGDLTTAIDASCKECSGTRILNVQIDGGRSELGGVEGGEALVLLGGDGGDQELRHCDISNARGYALVHVYEGIEAECEGVVVADNTIRDAGDSPLDLMLASELARLREGPEAYKGRDRPGLWTDGISVACAKSTILDNTVSDVSGVGIMLRGAPSSSVSQNIVVARDRDMLIGIGIVENPHLHSFDHADHNGLIVLENSIHAASAMIRIGISTGSHVWSPDSRTSQNNDQGTIPFGTEIVGNRITSYTGYLAYALALSDARGIVAQRNSVSASVWAAPTTACVGSSTALPKAPLVRDPRTARGSLQPEFGTEAFEFLLCVGPGTTAPGGAPREMTRHQINDRNANVRTRGKAGRGSTAQQKNTHSNHGGAVGAAARGEGAAKRAQSGLRSRR